MDARDVRGFANAVDRDPRVGLGAVDQMRPARRYFVTLRNLPESEGPKCKSADESIADAEFVAMVAIGAFSREEACGKAMAAYLSDNPGQSLVARAFPN